MVSEVNDMGKHIEGGRKEYFGMKASEGEADLMTRCAAHAGCSTADLVRWLFIEYAHVNGLPVRRDIPPALTAEELCAKLGLPAPGPVPYAVVERETVDEQPDPDRFFMDERTSSTLEPLPPTAR